MIEADKKSGKQKIFLKTSSRFNLTITCLFRDI